MKGITRRDTFAAVGAGSIGLVGFIGQAAAADLTPVEKANVQAVNEFMKAWADPKTDAAKLGAYLTEDSVVKMQEGKPALMGKAASVEAFKGFLSKGTRFDIKILETFAKGPVVANSRVDAAITDGKMGNPFSVVGVFIMKDGKVQEWADFVVPKQA